MGRGICGNAIFYQDFAPMGQQGSNQRLNTGGICRHKSQKLHEGVDYLSYLCAYQRYEIRKHGDGAAMVMKNSHRA
jgi:hypothetical protein